MKAWSRSDTRFLSRWWWTIDRVSLALVLALIAIGFLLILSASPAIAELRGFDRYHFLKRQLLFAGPAIAIMFGLSLLPLDAIKKVAVPFFGITLLLVCATHLAAPSVNGAQRWFFVGPFGIQPSEFMKPALVILLAWVFCEQTRLGQVSKYLIAAGLAGAAVLPVALQPDYGQTALILFVWGAMMFLAGLPFYWIGLLCLLAGAGAYFIYNSVSHVAQRIDGFIDPSKVDTYQLDMAQNAFEAGGLVGVGMGEGTFKRLVPDVHSDFIFAAAGEEFGFLFCLMILAVFVVFIWRGMVRAMGEANHFCQLAAGGLICLLGMQAFINMSVNVQLLPNKGMTLPFVSYGGSSLLATAIVAGLLFAVTRRRVRGGLPRHLRNLGEPG